MDRLDGAAEKPSTETILARLATMRAEGELSAAEYQSARRQLLGDAADEPAPPGTGAKKQPKVKRKGSPVLGLIVLGALIWTVVAVSHSSTPQSPADKAKAQAAADADRQKGFHCLSAWDGSSAALVSAVKESMREPSSFEHVETRIAPVNAKGQHAIIMTFRGRNGFGGMNVQNAVGALTHEGCALVDFAVE